MTRVDIYSTVHKGIRSLLFETSRLVARTDFSDGPEVERAVAAVRHLILHLDEHAEHEDAIVLPEIARFSANVFSDLQADHSRVGGLQRDIEDLLVSLDSSSGDERISLGRRLHEKMGRLTGEHLFHMDREETTANRILWAHFTDQELLALHARILAAVGPERLARWAEIILPSADPKERAAVIAGVSRVLPEDALARVRTLVSPALPAGMIG